MIPIVLFSGFLGSGKTSLVNHLLFSMTDRRTGILVNDFGQTVIDGGLIRKVHNRSGVDTYEIANGSVFCSCLTSNFIMGLKYFSLMKPEILFIEASGMSDPSGMPAILKNHGLDDVFFTAKIITVVDPVKTVKLIHVLPVIRRQIESADLILINKTDIATGDQIRGTGDMIGGINPDAEIMRTVHCRMEAAGFAEEIIAMKRKNTAVQEKEESLNTPENRPGSVLLTGDPDTPDAAVRFFNERMGQIFRVKGYFHVRDAGYYITDGGASVSASPAEEIPEGKTEVSVICPGEYADRISEDWKRFVSHGT